MEKKIIFTLLILSLCLGLCSSSSAQPFEREDFLDHYYFASLCLRPIDLGAEYLLARPVHYFFTLGPLDRFWGVWRIRGQETLKRSPTRYPSLYGPIPKRLNEQGIAIEMEQ